MITLANTILEDIYLSYLCCIQVKCYVLLTMRIWYAFSKWLHPDSRLNTITKGIKSISLVPSLQWRATLEPTGYVQLHEIFVPFKCEILPFAAGRAWHLPATEMLHTYISWLFLSKNVVNLNWIMLFLKEDV